MGALKGSSSYTRFRVEAEVPTDFRDRFTEALAIRAFRPLSPDDEEDERMGFCNLHQPFDLDLDASKLFLDDMLLVGLRIDRYRVPSALFKAHYQEAEAAFMEKAGLAEMSRTQKADLKLLVTKKLKRQILPSMKTVDFVWDLSRGEARFWNRSANLVESMSELFEKCFGGQLVVDAPYVVAEQAKNAEALTQGIGYLEPLTLGSAGGE